MRAALKNIRSPDVDLATYASEGSHFGFLVEAYFGPEGGDGAEQFQFLAGTPSWLEEVQGRRPALGKDSIVLSNYDASALRTTLSALAASLNGESWEDLARKLDRYGIWEFRDYRPVFPGTP